jgi:TM2 domain-containing membrane protein YozV
VHEAVAGTDVLEDSSPRSYATAVTLSSIFGFVGVQHFYLGRWGEGMLDLVLTVGWIWAAAAEHWVLFAAFLIADGAHALWVTIALLTGNFRDGQGLRVCYPGQRTSPRQIG